jgi:hypothetical protein
MAKPLDIKGRRFGLLVAMEELPRERGMRKWQLRCDCGASKVALQKAFTSGGKLRSCGCDNRRSVQHGLSSTPEYRAWINMKTRCYDQTTPYFDTYGGRGVQVCSKWLTSFEAFYADMGRRPSEKHSIDRIDNDGNYEPGNCRWAIQKVQSRNQRTNKLVSVEGKRITLAEAVESAPVPYNTVLYRLKRGWPVEAAISYPARKGFRPHAS